MISTATLRLTHEQTIELISHLQQVIDEFNTKYRDQKREGLRPISIRTDVFPLPEEGGAS